MKSAIKNLKITAFVCTTLVSSALFSGSVFGADTPASIPTSFLGTYSLTYANAQAGSPITNGTAVDVILAPGGIMCVAGYTLSNPVLRNSNGHEAIWAESSIGIELAVSSILSGFNEINVGSTTGTWYGQLRGSKTSTSTTGCGSVVTPEPDLTQINELFAQAQKHFAQFFPTATASANQNLDGYIYRFYSATNVYLAINDGQVYVMGGDFGGTPSQVGPLESLLSELAGMDVDIPDIDIPDGDSTLVITGKVGTSGVVVDIGAITIDNLPMPSAGDIDDVRDMVREQYKDAGLTGDITVTVISSSSSSIVYNIKFNGSITQSGFTLTQLYDLTFSYSKK